MKKLRFIDSQIPEALKRVVAGLATPEICRELYLFSHYEKLYVYEIKVGRSVFNQTAQTF